MVEPFIKTLELEKSAKKFDILFVAASKLLADLVIDHT